jgi:hypothetical protein
VEIRETENPNIEGWLSKSRLSNVDLPTPEGPDITIGRRSTSVYTSFDVIPVMTSFRIAFEVVTRVGCGCGTLKISVSVVAGSTWGQFWRKGVKL